MSGQKAVETLVFVLFPGSQYVISGERRTHMNSIHDRIEPLDDDDEDAPIPGTVLNRRQARLLKYVVIFLGLLLVAGFALLIGIIAWRASQPGKTSPPIVPAGVVVPQADMQGTVSPSGTAHLARQARKYFEGRIARDARLLDSTANGNRLVLTLQKPDGDLQLVMIDLAHWQITGTALLKQQ